MTDKERELLKKLKALSERGIGGEKINAVKKLKELMSKLNISLDDLENEKEIDCWFYLRKRKNTTFDFEKKLLMQIVSNCLDATAIKHLRGNLIAHKNKVLLVLQPTVAIEIKAKYEFYSDAFDNDFVIFYRSFIHANNLFSREVDDTPLSDKELEDLIKISTIQQCFEHEYLKQIAYKKE